MLSYCLLSFLLSILCVGLYKTLSQHLNLIQRKFALLGGALLCLLLPATSPSLVAYFAPNPKPIPSQYTGWNIVNNDDPLLMRCYQEAANSQNMCYCEIDQQLKQVDFTPSYWKKAHLYVEPILYPIFGLVALGFILLLAYRMLCLWYLSRFKSQTASRGHPPFYFVFPRRYLPLSAFSLWKHYIIWAPELDTLPPHEREAVLRHECAHLQQRDTWQAALWQLIQAFWWWNPCFYFMQKEWTRLREFVADDAALPALQFDVKRYAYLLLRLQTSQYTPALALGKNMLQQRIERLLNPNHQTLASPYARWWLGGATLLLWFSSLLLANFL